MVDRTPDVEPMRNRILRALALGLVAVIPASVGAAEVTPVWSADAPTGRAFSLAIDYEHQSRRGPLKRDVVENGSTILRSDLVYRESRDRLRVRSAGALYRDLSAFAALSFALADDRSLDFDRRAGNCGGLPNSCVTQDSSSLLRDGILPGYGAGTFGLNAETGQPFASPSGRVFQGPTRKGIEYLSLGLSYAIHNQRRDATKPTWVVSAETRLSVGTDQRFDPGKPTANRGVGLGYHQIILSSVFSKAYSGIEPSMGAWLMEPVLTSSSVYRDTGLSASRPQRRLGGHVGVDMELWNDPEGLHRLAFEVHGTLEFRFRGLAQNELWEALSGDSRCATDATRCRAGIDTDRTNDGQADPHRGVVVSPAYGVFGGDMAIAAKIHRYARLRASFGMTVEQQHTLSDGSSKASAYDQAGRYFHSDAMVGWRLLCAGGASF
jgi:hypothetical protein